MFLVKRVATNLDAGNPAGKPVEARYEFEYADKKHQGTGLNDDPSSVGATSGSDGELPETRFNEVHHLEVSFPVRIWLRKEYPQLHHPVLPTPRCTKQDSN
jgi:hypothetical protein